MAEFNLFSNYWYFSELANKDEEIEHFRMQCEAFRVGEMKAEVEMEIEKLSNTLDRIYQLRNTDSINRLAMLSMILGGGAMLTGYFGMNFGHGFAKLFFEPAGPSWVHVTSITAVTAIVVGSILFGVFLVVTFWADYRDILMPLRKQRRRSLRKTTTHGEADS